MAASVKIEFDDGSRVISQTLEDTAGMGDAKAGGGGGSALFADKRPASSSIDEFYEISKTTAFIGDGNFRRVALQFPDPLLREAPEVLWTLQARLRKLTSGSAQEGREVGGVEEGSATATPPLIFVTGDTSYGSCCVDEVSAQHLKADAIVHYGRACLSPTNSSVPVLYVFGRGQLDVKDLASTLLSGPLSLESPPPAAVKPSGTESQPLDEPSTLTVNPETDTKDSSGKPPVLLLYDVTYAYAIPALLEALAGVGVTARDGRLVTGFPTPEAYAPVAAEAAAAASKRGGCGCGAGTSASASSSSQEEKLPFRAFGSEAEAARKGCSTTGEQCCHSGGGGKTCCDCEGGETPGRTPPRGSSRGDTEARRACATAAAGCNSGCGNGECAGDSSRRGAEVASNVTSNATIPPGPPPGSETVALEMADDVSRGSASVVAGGGAAAAGTLSATATPTSRTTKTVSSSTAPSPSQELQERRRVRIGGLGVELESEEELRRHTLVFVGGEGRQLSNILMRCASCVDRVRYDPTLPAGERIVGDTRKGNKDLMRRYYLVQRAREAGVIGIVVGTLGVQRYGSVVRSLRRMVEDAGRKAYTLAVGKVNVAKLANFTEVDVFCLVACAENSLLDSREFHAPVVTPLELEVALGKRDWDGFYSTDFDDLVGMGSQKSPPKPKPKPEPRPDSEGSIDIKSLSLAESGAAVGVASKNDDGGGGESSDADEDDQPFFSLVTGTYKSKPGVSQKPEGGHNAGSGGGGGGGGSGENNAAGGGEALVGVGDRSIVEWSSPAADFLGKREFQGLEALIGQTEVKAATEGQSGIASDYGGV